MSHRNNRNNGKAPHNRSKDFRPFRDVRYFRCFRDEDCLINVNTPDIVLRSGRKVVILQTDIFVLTDGTDIADD